MATAMKLQPENGCLRAATSHMTTPKLYTSADSQYFSPRITSGAAFIIIIIIIEVSEATFYGGRAADG
jgi:hypothetical protein